MKGIYSVNSGISGIATDIFKDMSTFEKLYLPFVIYMAAVSILHAY